MEKYPCAILAVALFCVLFVQVPSRGDLIYGIGNSLTWDTRPESWDGDVEYHIDCGKNLQDIFDDPSSPCVGTSRIWTDALYHTQYQWMTVQPHLFTTLEQDATVISEWMSMQPGARLVLHTGWSLYSKHETDYHAGNPNNQMLHSPEYFAALLAELHVRNPGRMIISTRAIDVLDDIYHEIETGGTPFQDFSELYRDIAHLDTSGQFLMHNLMRRALDQPFSDAGFENLRPDIKSYLIAKIQSIPEPSVCVVPMILLAIGVRARLRVSPSDKALCQVRSEQGIVTKVDRH